MTDLPTELGATASCPSCGAQVTVPDGAGAGASVACSKCGAAVPTEQSATEGEVTMDEVLRAFGVNGYDTDFAVQRDRVVCGACAAATGAEGVRADEVRTVSDELRGGPDVVAVALVCPSCGTLGRLLLDSGDDDQLAVARSLGASEG
jgi:DNA-directed RNA polymerase subunit M/transcription elongation factor TFIIS